MTGLILSSILLRTLLSEVLTQP
jgi:hypothetical protein